MNILIVGGSDWLGKKLALSFAGVAENIILLARNGHKLKAVKDEIAGTTNVYDYICDLANIDQIKSVVMEIEKMLPSLDLVLNVAGGSYVGGTLECSPEDFFQMVDSYIKGQAFLIKELIPLFRKSNSTLLVNFLADWAVRKAGMECGNAIYTMTKVAISAFTDCLISEEHHFGLRATNIFLGQISVADSINEIERDKNGLADQLFMDDICNFVGFIVNSESLHITDVILSPKSPSYARGRIHTNSSKYDI